MSENSLTIEQSKETRGRPSLYNPTIVGKILAAFQLGLSVKTVCSYVGINHDTLYEWINKYPDFSEKVSQARSYATLLAAQTVQDVLQDVQRGKPDPRTGKMEKQKYSESSRVSTARWYLERQEREAFGSGGSLVGTKVEQDGKGGTTTTVIYATDEYVRDLFSTIPAGFKIEDVDPAEFLEIPEGSIQGADMAGGENQERPALVHTEELQHQHTEN